MPNSGPSINKAVAVTIRPLGCLQIVINSMDVQKDRERGLFKDLKEMKRKLTTATGEMSAIAE